jgi:hypothetical protein
MKFGPFEIDLEAAHVIGSLTGQNTLVTSERDDLRRQVTFLRREVLIQKRKARMLRQKLRAAATVNPVTSTADSKPDPGE